MKFISTKKIIGKIQEESNVGRGETICFSQEKSEMAPLHRSIFAFLLMAAGILFFLFKLKFV